MKILITNYTFDKTAKTVTFTDYATIRLDSILLITNATSNVIIYNFSNPLKGGTVATNVLTLIYDTSAMSNTDKLQIFYQDENVSMGAVTEAAPATDTASSGINGRLQRIAQRITSLIALIPASLGQKTKAASLAVTLASDQDVLAVSLAAETTKVIGTVNVSAAQTVGLVAGSAAIGKLTANSGVIIGDVNVVNSNVSTNVSQINGVTPLMGNGATGTGSSRVTIANDNTPFPIKIDQTTPGTTNKVSVGTDVISTTEVAPTTIINGKTTVTTATTRVQLATNTCKSITVKALAANTGIIYVGNATVAAANGFQLAAGDSVTMDISNTNVVYIDSSVNGEGISFIANN